jgi:hypothetical protein
MALGVLVRGRLRCSFGVTIEAAAPAPPGFWVGLHEFANRHAVTDFWVESIGALESTSSIPPLPKERQRFANIKLYMIHLETDNSLECMATNHRRNIVKAQRNAIELVELPEAEAILAHRRLGASSLARRKARGEPTGSMLPGEEGRAARLLATGTSRLYQASHSGSIVSSKLVLVLGEHAYYLAGGTTEEGMRLGASHFLMYQIICTLKAAGVRTLNLDVASVAAGGLGRFKEGFGAEILCIERAHCDLTSPAKLVRNFTHRLLHQGMAA